MPKAPKYKSLAEALIAVFGNEENPAPMKAGDAIKLACELHPPAKGGKTQAATAGTAILNLVKKGHLVKTGPAMYTTPERAPAPAPKRRTRKEA